MTETTTPTPAAEASPLPQHRIPLFWRKAVAVAGGCWEWAGTIGSHGYGMLIIRGRPARAHRVSYELAKGPITAGLTIDHLCRNRKCVNPSHLEAVTVRENTLRGSGPSARNAAATHCVRGHEMSGSNLLITTRKDSRSRRNCRECNRIRDRRRNKCQTQ